MLTRRNLRITNAILTMAMALVAIAAMLGAISKMTALIIALAMGVAFAVVLSMYYFGRDRSLL